MFASLCIDQREVEEGNKSDWNKLVSGFYDSVDERSNEVILIWPDTIPIQYRKDDDYIYQAPPSFKIFEECWLFSIIKSDNNSNRVSLVEKYKFFHYYLSPSGQKLYLDNGAVPIHKFILASLDTWLEYPFVPPLCQIYLQENVEHALVKNWQGISGIARKFQKLITALRKMPRKKEAIQEVISHWK
ncbi:hypothetical protein [Dyadobacter chenhuakuii]|uniref:Uncharacterized protein n=1 Tax=Dyadobacter chenhuakuii TaxID=2909339 RepID=A0ABY4XMV0_9BACT|nr:hypothetical protein [Dyadobacter chenhuakuii]MCF2494289.1 hypothetical protein [Dyadobacter chenhuakuii]USJ31413.1 hypothetical protein NFI80_01465 [Dyadobacter chenhuakuii]